MSLFTSTQAPIRVLIIDDHRTVLWGLGKLIESARPHMELVGTATCSDEALASLSKTQPHVVLLDLDLSVESGLDLLPLIREHAAVLIITGSREAVCETLVLNGARGVVHKSDPADVVLKAIARVHEGETWVDRRTMGRVLGAVIRSQKPTDPYDALSQAERRTLRAVLDHKGAPNKVIAAAIHISEHTLRNQLSSIYSKLGVRRRMDLVFYVREHSPHMPGARIADARLV